MTANEMRKEFLILYNGIMKNTAPGLKDSEIGIILTKAQDTFLNDADKSEDTEMRRKEFSELKRNATPSLSSSQTGVHPNGYFFDLPSDFMWTWNEEVTTSSSTTCKNNKRIPVDPITEDEYNRNIHNPFRNPYCNDNEGIVWRMDFSKASSTSSKRHELITDGTFTIGTYHLRYFKKPSDIRPFTSDGSTTSSSDCELDESSHRQIIDIAVRIATGAKVPQEYQIKINEEKINEPVQ